jgi:hypothetical protein
MKPVADDRGRIDIERCAVFPGKLLKRKLITAEMILPAE